MSDPNHEALTFTQFLKLVSNECIKAWDNGKGDPYRVCLPHGVFPYVTEIVNPVTRSVIRVKRVPWLYDETEPQWKWQPLRRTLRGVFRGQTAREIEDAAVRDAIAVFGPGSHAKVLSPYQVVKSANDFFADLEVQEL